MLTRIRNANIAKHDTVDIPASNLKKSIAQILLEEGYIAGYECKEDNKLVLFSKQSLSHLRYAWFSGRRGRRPLRTGYAAAYYNST